MGSPLFQNEGGNYMLPSTFSPWRSDGPISEEQVDLGDSNSKSTTGADATRRSVESMVSPNSASSLSPSYISGSSLARRTSSAFYSPQSLNAASPIIPDPPSPRAFTTPPQIVLSPSTSTKSTTTTAETVSSIYSPETERQSSLRSTLGDSSLAAPTPSEQSAPAVYSNLNAMRNAAIMPTHPRAESVPMTAIYDPEPSPISMGSEDDGDANNYSSRYAEPQLDCYSRRDVHIKRWSWLYVTLILSSIYSTGFSGLWLVVSIYQPQYGRGISTGSGWQITPSTATLLATLAAKTIELTFVTVFVAVLGQVLTRRAFSRSSKGVTLAEMTMRNWVIQPGSLLTHWEGLPYAGTTVLGALTLTATICALFYTTASDAMVSPKLKRQGWMVRDMQGLVKVSYANPYYVSDNCQTPLFDADPDHAKTACLDVLFSGQSYHSLIAFMTEWDGIHYSGNSTMHQLADRPTGKHNLLDNTTMDSSWIEAEYGNPAAQFDAQKRIINNVTLAMPHAGVYAAATDPINGILQPNELLGVGEYSIRASVVSPAVNVMCVNMNADELAPLVYTTWPNARTEGTEIPGQKIGVDGWGGDVPSSSPTEWLNSTVVDDVFRWGEQYGRRPPVFQLYPIDYNMITNVSTDYTDSLYILAKTGNISDYTLCELRSWVTAKCSTAFDLSGTSGGHMKAHCEDPTDANAYERIYPEGAALTPLTSGDWRNLAEEWRLSINLNGGTQNNNASNARVLTNLILGKPELDPLLPSMAEAIAVLASSTLVAGSLDSTFKSTWTYGTGLKLEKGVYETFHAQVQTQQYASAHTASWQAIFYPVLGLVFVLNVLCLLYLAFGTALAPPSSSSPTSKANPRIPFSIPFARKKTHGPVKESNESDSENEDVAGSRPSGSGSGKAANGLVTDYTEPQNLFALAVNSPPSRALAGSCGHGPDSAEMVVPWRVGYAAGANHYFFEEEDVGQQQQQHEKGHKSTSSGVDLLGENDGQYGQSYKRLSTKRAWL
ncbi:hypothetical protein HD806DRAFT_488657 [Xylariaceae sp. AK1471]|nr:hypothetical protein HD806DRAFT_488657 [Xylariaceae sp. AK1471]